MATFGVETKDSPELRMFLRETNERLERHDFMKNPFKGKIVKFQDFLVVSMKPIYPNVWWLSLFLLIPAFIFQAPGWVYLLSLPFFFIAFMHSPSFFFIMFLMGLKKKGHKGRVKLMPQQKTIEKLLREL